MNRLRTAYIAPFAVFMFLLALKPLAGRIAASFSPTLAQAPEHLVYPLQTLICGTLLGFFWRHYDFKRVAKILLTLGLAFCIFAIWISPQWLFHAPPRLDGFDPTLFASNHALFITVLALRFVRLVLVVPLLEEILWRGFLLRDLIDRDFEKVPVGAYSAFSCWTVTFFFGLAHWGTNTWLPGPDFVPALIAGLLFNYVAYRTRSLGSCVLAHAATNLLLGIYIVQTGQWGFW